MKSLAEVLSRPGRRFWRRGIISIYIYIARVMWRRCDVAGAGSRGLFLDEASGPPRSPHDGARVPARSNKSPEKCLEGGESPSAPHRGVRHSVQRRESAGRYLFLARACWRARQYGWRGISCAFSPTFALNRATFHLSLAPRCSQVASGCDLEPADLRDRCRPGGAPRGG